MRNETSTRTCTECGKEAFCEHCISVSIDERYTSARRVSLCPVCRLRSARETCTATRAFPVRVLNTWLADLREDGRIEVEPVRASMAAHALRALVRSYGDKSPHAPITETVDHTPNLECPGLLTFRSFVDA